MKDRVGGEVAADSERAGNIFIYRSIIKLLAGAIQALVCSKPQASPLRELARPVGRGRSLGYALGRAVEGVPTYQKESYA